MSDEKRSNACPSCLAKPGEPCTQPTSNSRVQVGWEHFARIDERSRPQARETVVLRLTNARVVDSRDIEAQLSAGSNVTNIERFTEDEARALAMQLLDVAGITDEMCQAFREGWLTADLSGNRGGRVRSGLKALVRMYSTGGE